MLFDSLLDGIWTSNLEHFWSQQQTFKKQCKNEMYSEFEKPWFLRHVFSKTVSGHLKPRTSHWTFVKNEGSNKLCKKHPKIMKNGCQNHPQNRKMEPKASPGGQKKRPRWPQVDQKAIQGDPRRAKRALRANPSESKVDLGPSESTHSSSMIHVLFWEAFGILWAQFFMK